MLQDSWRKYKKNRIISCYLHVYTHELEHACIVRIVIMHRFSSASAGRSSALLITIQADWAKRDETGHTGATTARQNKGWMARRGGVPARQSGYVHDASYLRRKKRVGESPRRTGAGKGQ